MRMFARFIGIGYIFYLLLALIDIPTLAAITASWWTPVALVVFFGPGLALGAVSTGAGRPSVLRSLAALTAVTYLIGLLTWVGGWSGAPLPEGRTTWFSLFPALSALAAACVWRPPWVFGQLAAATFGAQFINYTARTAAGRNPLVPDVVYGFGESLLFVGAGIMGARTGRLLDKTRAETYAAAADTAAMHARTVERQRFDALTHDSVMSTLLAASRMPVNAGLVRQAELAVTQLDRLRVGVLPIEDFDSDAVLAHLRVAATEVDESISLAVRLEPGAEHIRVPAEAVRTIGAGMGEALRNSRRHAGAGASRMVSAAIEPGGLRVVVADTGKGFDPSTVPEHRLGVAVSIRARMQHLPGGSARVESRPNVGTRIEFAWTRTP
ncbi:putative two-component system sensor kinase [Rhodococcus wratislaviensis]|uniref:Putative two-component system sensor kinase n=1 Tax=Rhodococcus wratislaviensis TaxID=44752 RepID=A0A402C5K5_RHOWR|nr:putative two-component system sensor kinase [Rhodococcus wratislaviensis]